MVSRYPWLWLRDPCSRRRHDAPRHSAAPAVHGSAFAGLQGLSTEIVDGELRATWTCSSPRPRLPVAFLATYRHPQWRVAVEVPVTLLERSAAHHTHGALRVGDAHRRRAGPVAHEHVAVRLSPGGGHPATAVLPPAALMRRCGLHPRDHLRWLLGVPGRHVEGRYRLHHAGACGHTDKARTATTPGRALLHCLEFVSQGTGGESTMVDAFAIARRMEAEHADLFEVLSSVNARPVHRRRGTFDGGEVGVPSRPPPVGWCRCRSTTTTGPRSCWSRPT